MVSSEKTAKLKKNISFCLNLTDASLLSRMVDFYIETGGPHRVTKENFVNLLTSFVNIKNVSKSRKRIITSIVELGAFDKFSKTMETIKSKLNLKNEDFFVSLKNDICEIVSMGLGRSDEHFDEFGDFYNNKTKMSTTYFNLIYSSHIITISFNVCFYNKFIKFLDYCNEMLSFNLVKILEHPNYPCKVATPEEIKSMNDIELSYRYFCVFSNKNGASLISSDKRGSIYKIKKMVEESFFDFVNKISKDILVENLVEKTSQSKLDILTKLRSREVLVSILIEAEKNGTKLVKLRAINLIRKIWGEERGSKQTFSVDRIIWKQALSRTGSFDIWSNLINHCIDMGVISQITSMNGRILIREERGDEVINAKQN